MPSLQETVTPDAEYVNTDVISEIIKQDHPDFNNKNAAIAVTEIIQKEDNHVCNIKIKATTSTPNDESVPAPVQSSNIRPQQQLKISQPAKRSVSSISSARPSGLKVGFCFREIVFTDLPLEKCFVKSAL